MELPGPTFFALAKRLPAYEGACKHSLQLAAAEPDEIATAEIRTELYDEVIDPVVEVEEAAPVSVLSAEQLAAVPAAPELGQDVGLFEVVRCT